MQWFMSQLVPGETEGRRTGISCMFYSQVQSQEKSELLKKTKPKHVKRRTRMDLNSLGDKNTGAAR